MDSYSDNKEQSKLQLSPAGNKFFSLFQSVEKNDYYHYVVFAALYWGQHATTAT